MTKAGRPTSYRKEFAKQAAKLCALGATDQEVADFFEVDVRTIHRWKHDKSEFCHSLKAGKEVADERVERSLYQRAVGYSYASEKIFHYQGSIVRADCVEHSLPDVTACIFWMKNRRPEQWREKPEGDGPATPSNDVVDALVERLRA